MTNIEMKYIVLKEHDYLFSKGGRDLNDARHKWVDENTLADLEDFLLGNQTDAGNNPLELMHLCSLKRFGKAIQANNYVGVIELDHVQIEILPKISSASDKESRDMLRTMLIHLGNNQRAKTIGSAHLLTENMPLFEVFIAMFVDEVQCVVRQGLKSSYITCHSNEAFAKGKIDITENIRSNLIHRERFALEYDVFSANRPENRLIKSTLILLSRKSRDARNKLGLKRLLASFDGIEASSNIDADFMRCIPGRDTEMYTTVLEWCSIFLHGESFSMFKGKHVSTALLFPMETVFENYVASLVKQAARSDSRFQCAKAQVQSKYLFKNRRIKLKPDLLVFGIDESWTILDTKWKQLDSLNQLDLADMHQMYAYGKKYQSERHGSDGEPPQCVVLVYPKPDSQDNGFRKDVSFISDDGVRVDIFYINIGSRQDAFESVEKLLSGISGKASPGPQ